MPIALPDERQPEVRVVLHGLPVGALDVSSAHVPVSLRPFMIGLHVDPTVIGNTTPGMPLRLDIFDAKEAAVALASIHLSVTGRVSLSQGVLLLVETTGCHNRCVSPPIRWWRYLLAARHASRSAARGDRLRMSARDLRCLNAYYIVARPVFLVGVANDTSTNLFPMDLVGSLSSGEYLLTLRATSASIAVMEDSRRIAMSGAPAALHREVYALGKQHHMRSIEFASIPVAVRPSDLFGLPVLAQPGLVRELTVTDAHRIGSHVLFVCTVASEKGQTSRQLAHVSGMYGEWLARRARPVQSLA
ncbi:MAG: hypothetical protein V4550_11775 [Gemmatimonadota bacterium]